MQSHNRQLLVQRGLAASVRILLLALILGLLALLLGATSTSAQADAGGELIFARIANGAPGGEGIYRINADGSNERPLALFADIGYPYALESGGYRCPAWSPDGAQIAFNGALDGHNYIVVMNADGSDARTVYAVENDSTTTRQLHYPRWVPGSDRISFSFTEADARTGALRANGVRSVGLDGRDLQTIRDDIALTFPGGEPVTIGGLLPNFLSLTHAWSPDGAQLAISSYNNRVFLTDAAGTTLRPLEASYLVAGGVDWSPDGRHILSSHFHVASYTPEDGGRRDIVPLPTDMLDETIESVTWSPDGSQIAYTSYVIDISTSPTLWRVKLVVVDVATGEQREIVRTPDFDRSAYPWGISCVDWRPDGAD